MVNDREKASIPSCGTVRFCSSLRNDMADGEPVAVLCRRSTNRGNERTSEHVVALKAASRGDLGHRHVRRFEETPRGIEPRARDARTGLPSSPAYRLQPTFEEIPRTPIGFGAAGRRPKTGGPLKREVNDSGISLGDLIGWIGRAKGCALDRRRPVAPGNKCALCFA